MTLPLQPESIALLYEYLRSLPPFSAIKAMPAADDVEFCVINDRSIFAKWSWHDGVHRISISSKAISQTGTLAMYLGHEACHIGVDVQGLNTGGNANTHNAAFRKLAKRFCRVHGFDLKAFY